jgi:hypothetical protein
VRKIAEALGVGASTLQRHLVPQPALTVGIVLSAFRARRIAYKRNAKGDQRLGDDPFTVNRRCS